MSTNNNQPVEEIELQEWLESIDYVIQSEGDERAKQLLQALQARAHSAGIHLPFSANTPYINSIAAEDQPT